MRSFAGTQRVGPRTRVRAAWRISVICAALILVTCSVAAQRLEAQYQRQFSATFYDRNGKLVIIGANAKGHYATADDHAPLPQRLQELLIAKEDRFFRYHPGINPISVIRSVVRYGITGTFSASSTITEQLAKILLGHEQERTVGNRLAEMFAAITLELSFTKSEILSMYAESVYLGNQAQGFSEASFLYFRKPLGALTDEEMWSLIAALSSPSLKNPWKSGHIQYAKTLAESLGYPFEFEPTPATASFSYQNNASFELQTLGLSCSSSCITTIDADLTERLRAILRQNIARMYDKGARNGAIVAIKVPKNEILALVGSHKPGGGADGEQINMALKPRPVGSAIKPLIYLEGFKRGLRPYTRVVDREYKYSVATGFPLYPKNYDGLYRGEVTLHEALANSLNVPSVKVLEFIGLDAFYSFLSNEIGFVPIQDLDQYQFGIALGGLEMDLLSLTHLFTVFPNGGILKPLAITSGAVRSAVAIPPQIRVEESRALASPEYAALVTKILSDRETGVGQFGARSNLDLSFRDYAVKTGTSRDFHDSWVVGYTSDIVLGVWIGNSENTSLRELSGQSGAGKIWKEAMELIATTPYHTGTPLNVPGLAPIKAGSSYDWGIAGDNYEDHAFLLSEDEIILAPHNGDRLERTDGMSIPLKATTDAAWYVNGVFVGKGARADWKPNNAGLFRVEARNGDRAEQISVFIEDSDPNPAPR